MLAGLLLAAAASRGGAEATAVGPRTLAVIEPQTLHLAAALPLDGTPSDVAIGRRAAFVALAGNRTVVAVDPDTHTSAALGTPFPPRRLAAGGGAVWLLDGPGGRVARLGSTRSFAVAPPGPPSLAAIAAAENAVWLAELDTEMVLRLDPRSSRVERLPNGGLDSFFEGGARRAVAVGGGSLWSSNPVTRYPATERFGRVSRIDLQTRRVTARIRVPSPPVAIAAGGDELWVALERGEEVWRIDMRDNVASGTVRVPGGVAALAVGEGAVWALGADGLVSRIDPATRAVTGALALGRPATAIAAGHGSVWVAVR